MRISLTLLGAEERKTRAAAEAVWRGVTCANPLVNSP
jgi:hypothetical protein